MACENSQILFALLRSAVCGARLDESVAEALSNESLAAVMNISRMHDVAHLAVAALQSNGIASIDAQPMLKAIYRSAALNNEYKQLCSALENAGIGYIPLKGAILRQYYPEPWMRTSCDIDVLVRPEDLERAILYLTENLQYEEKERATHDVSLFSPDGVHVELHFDLVEEGRANKAIDVLRAVWDNVSVEDGYSHRYVMTDAFFYFYHIAHMAKHFENGGCGIRPFIDLWLLDNIEGIDKSARDALLEEGGLLQFAGVARNLSRAWLGGAPMDELSIQMQNFILRGGTYGTTDNRVALQQKKRGGRLGYILSRMFVPPSKLKRYYPILEKHPWLMPIMQLRRWFMLLNPDVAKMAKREIKLNNSIDSSKADEMNSFLKNVGL